MKNDKVNGNTVVRDLRYS